MVTNPAYPSPFGQCTLLDFVSRRQKRVCRSTFAAEIRAFNDCCERARVIQLAVEEAMYGPITAAKALKMEFADDGALASQLKTSLEACVDLCACMNSQKQTPLSSMPSLQ